jgi:hypothetical protein
MADEAGNNSSGNTSPPEGKLYKQPIGIQQTQGISLWAQISRMGKPRLLAQTGGMLRATVARVVARLRRGRPEYDRRPYIALAEELIKGGVDPSQDAFVGRLRSMLELQDKLPVPGDTVLTEICGPIYKRELAKTGEK